MLEETNKENSKQDDELEEECVKRLIGVGGQCCMLTWLKIKQNIAVKSNFVIENIPSYHHKHFKCV